MGVNLVSTPHRAKTVPPTRLLPLLIAWLVIALLSPAALADEAALWRALAGGGHVALMRHALAPGTGDPDNFRIGDCATQRNLSDEGRRQARRTGDAFRANGVANVRIRSSQWCRCMETAKLLGLGEVTAEPMLNSLYQRPGMAERQTAQLKSMIAALDPGGPSLVLVSHQINIRRITGDALASGAIAVVKPEGAGGIEVLGHISAR